jgi:hypothetical protein
MALTTAAIISMAQPDPAHLGNEVDLEPALGRLEKWLILGSQLLCLGNSHDLHSVLLFDVAPFAVPALRFPDAGVGLDRHPHPE